MARVRVIQRADGQVSVIRPATPDLPLDEFDRVCSFIVEKSAATPIPLVGLPFVDLDDQDLPARTAPCPDDACDAEHVVRDQWSLEHGKVVIDATVPNAHRELDHVYAQIETHLDQEAPDPIEHTRLLADVQRLVPMTRGCHRGEVANAIQAVRSRKLKA